MAAAAMERYTLYLVEREQYQLCQPQSRDQVRWQCNQPSARHDPEKLSEKFQRFTPFTLGKEFKEGHSYYYICESPGRAHRPHRDAAGVRHVLSTKPHTALPILNCFNPLTLHTWYELLCTGHSAWHRRHRDQ